MPTKGPLSAAVEAASGGKQTVLYTAKGQPTYMNVIPAFNLQDIGGDLGTGLHPAFIVNGVQKSEIYIGTYQAVVEQGEALSLPSRLPEHQICFDDARAVCAAAGPGFHLMTNWEWAAISLWCAKNGRGHLTGNVGTFYRRNKGADAKPVWEEGWGWRDLMPTGSGLSEWRHDGTAYGIADLVGNVWEWVDGLKVDGRQIIMPADNAYMLPESNWESTNTTFGPTEPGQIYVAFEGMVVSPGNKSSVSLKQAMVSPASNSPVGYIFADTYEGWGAMAARGGPACQYSGLATMHLNIFRWDSSCNTGMRLAFID